MDGPGSGGAGRRVRPRVLLLLLLAWLAMLLPTLLAFQKHLACGQGGCGQHTAAPEPLVWRDASGGLASRSAMEAAASGGSSRSGSGGSRNSTQPSPHVEQKVSCTTACF